MRVYVVKIEFQGITDTIETFENEQDAIDKFAESLKGAIPEIGHKIRHNDLDFWYVHWENIDALLENTDFAGSQVYHSEMETRQNDSYWQPEIERLQQTQRALNRAYGNLTTTQKLTKELGLEAFNEHIDNMLLAISECKDRNKMLILGCREMEKENDS